MYNTDELLKKLDNGGAFLTAGAGEKANTMTIGWGTVGYLWGKPVLFVLVRTSRHTQKLIEEGKCFTVSVPTDDQKRALAYVGTHSGAKENKWINASLTPVKAKKVNTMVVEGAIHQYECELLTQMPLAKEFVPADMLAKWYKNPDFHTIYVGEIVAEY